VDDEDDVLEFLKIFLESLGWTVTTVRCAEEAFATLKDTVFFLVITDIAMPQMDGYEFISRLRELKLDSRLAVMTGFGYNPEHTLVKINKTMKYPFLFKPFNRKKVIEVVQNAWDSFHGRVPPVPA